MSSMQFYNLDPDRMRDLHAASSGKTLARDGSNLASVLLRLHEEAPEIETRIEEYLRVILPGLIRLDAQLVEPTQFVQFWQKLGPKEPVTNFRAMNMSDGTLRALGILVALFQFADGIPLSDSLVGIEEPESALHPAAAGVLRDALREASEHTQVIVASHSPDLLDDPSISENDIIAVNVENGATIIGPLDYAGRSVLHDKLFTPGELLRMNQLQPDHAQGEPTPTETEA
jgi:predicted ATPase